MKYNWRWVILHQPARLSPLVHASGAAPGFPIAPDPLRCNRGNLSIFPFSGFPELEPGIWRLGLDGSTRGAELKELVPIRAVIL